MPVLEPVKMSSHCGKGPNCGYLGWPSESLAAARPETYQLLSAGGVAPVTLVEVDTFTTVEGGEATLVEVDALTTVEDGPAILVGADVLTTVEGGPAEVATNGGAR